MNKKRDEQNPEIKSTYYAEESKINKKYNRIRKIIGYSALALTLAFGGLGVTNGIKAENSLDYLIDSKKTYQQKYNDTNFILNSTKDLKRKNEHILNLYGELGIDNGDYKERAENLEKRVTMLNTKLDSIESLEKEEEKEIRGDIKKYNSRTGYSLGGVLLTLFGFIGAYAGNEKRRRRDLDNFEDSKFGEKNTK